ncbi:MAG: hypothetical protein FWE28_02995 [Oscillospiraceae bacterium]|nr:hypothetical protein [Oscillospiraceae bacterium]
MGMPGGAGGWVIVIVRVRPPPVIVTVPVRLLIPVLKVVLSRKLPLPVRFAGAMSEMVSQLVLLLLTLHCMLDVTLTVTLLAAGAGFHVDGLIVRSGAACVTAIVRVTPPPVIVTLPVLLDVPVLAVALIRKLPFPIRFAGVMFEISSQFTSLVGAFHVILDVTGIVMSLAIGVGSHRDELTVRFGATCVTVMVCVIPLPVIVTLPVLLLILVLGETRIRKLPFPMRFAGVMSKMVSQLVLLLLTLHCVLEVTLTIILSAVGAGFQVDWFMLSVGAVHLAQYVVFAEGASVAGVICVPPVCAVNQPTNANPSRIGIGSVPKGVPGIRAQGCGPTPPFPFHVMLGVIDMVNCWAAAGALSPEPCAITVKVKLPMVVGVPEISPLEKVNPGGRVPDISRHVSGNILFEASA